MSLYVQVGELHGAVEDGKCRLEDWERAATEVLEGSVWRVGDVHWYARREGVGV